MRLSAGGVLNQNVFLPPVFFYLCLNAPERGGCAEQAEVREEDDLLPGLNAPERGGCAEPHINVCDRGSHVLMRLSAGGVLNSRFGKWCMVNSL